MNVARFDKLCGNSPAPISSSSDSDNCLTTSALRSHTELLGFSARICRVACSAGTNPQASPAANVMAKLNTRIRQCGSAPWFTESVPCEGNIAGNPFTPQGVRKISAASPRRPNRHLPRRLAGKVRSGRKLFLADLHADHLPENGLPVRLHRIVRHHDLPAAEYLQPTRSKFLQIYPRAG